MHKKTRFVCSVVFLFFISSAVALAHQPMLVWDTATSLNAPIVIENPEVSKAYYGNLKGDRDYYVIKSDVSFDLYLNVLVPDLDGVIADVSLTVKKDGVFFHFVDGIDAEWTQFYEEFGGDNYLKGPEYKDNVPAGTYDIEVSNLENSGKYVLAVGEKEEFGVGAIFGTLRDLPTLKSDFFGKSVWNAYFNRIGAYLAGFVVLVVVAVWVTWYFIIKKYGNKKV